MNMYKSVYVFPDGRVTTFDLREKPARRQEWKTPYGYEVQEDGWECIHQETLGDGTVWEVWWRPRPDLPRAE